MSVADRLLFLAAALMIVATVAIFGLEQTGRVKPLAATCPFTDNDAGDNDATVGVYEFATNRSFAGAATAYDCTSIGTVVVPDGITITFAGNPSTGVIAEFNFSNLTIETTGIIEADENGCPGVAGNGQGPSISNVCVTGGSGYGRGDITTGVGAGGAGHGGNGGDGTNRTKGTFYENSVAPVQFGASGGAGSTVTGGAGGGVVSINVSGILNHNGSISADGGVGSAPNNNNTGGGGAGGTIVISAATLNGSGTFSADGGNGSSISSVYSGGGGGGRIVVTYGGGSYFPFVSGDFSVAGGTATGSADSGDKGTVYVKNTTTNRVDVFHGFTYEDVDYSAVTWDIDSSATNQYCNTTSGATPSVSATALTLGGTLNCTTDLDSFNWSASSTFGVTTSTDMTVSSQGSTVDFNIPASTSVTMSGFTFNGAVEGYFTINDNVNLSLTNSTSISANAQLTTLASLTIDNTSSITSGGKGCRGVAGTGYGPNSSNICSVAGPGAGGGDITIGLGGGGGGHGGAGGNGDNRSGGSTYGSNTNPVLFGASGGGGSTVAGGAGGGYVYLDVDGLFSLSGTVSADGLAGFNPNNNNTGGGGAGGSVYIQATDFTCSSGVLSADGGDGMFSGGSVYSGGGGGGRVAVWYGTDNSSSSCSLSALTASTVAIGGSALGGSSQDGVDGTFYFSELPPEVTMEVGNEAPTLNGGTAKLCDGATASDNASISACSELFVVNLLSGSTKEVSFFIQASDDNGADDLAATATGVFYHDANASPASSSCSSDNNNCYRQTGCTKILPAIDSLTAWYRCDYSLQYYTDDSSDVAKWLGYIQVQDAAGSTASNNILDADINKLVGGSFPDISYGPRALGSSSTAGNNIEITHVNEGNVLLDFQVSLDNTAPGNTSALDCDTGTIPVANIRFDRDQSLIPGDLAYGSMTNTLVVDPATINLGIDISQRTNDSAPQGPTNPRVSFGDSGDDQAYSYWGISVPVDGVLGSCTEELIVTGIEG